MYHMKDTFVTRPWVRFSPSVRNVPNRSAKRSPRRKRHAAQYTNVLFEGTFKRPTWSLKTKWNLEFKRVKSEIRSHIALQVAPFQERVAYLPAKVPAAIRAIGSVAPD
jgi:hypothetical protein